MAYEIDFRDDGDVEWARLPRRCRDMLETGEVLMKLLDLYLQNPVAGGERDKLELRVRKVE